MKILAEKFDYFIKKVEKLSKKSQKILGEEISFIVNGNEFIKNSSGEILEWLDIDITFPEIKIKGWTPIIAIEHNNEGNIVHNFKCEDDTKIYRTISSNCVHCKTNRQRNKTFILENEEGEKIQVGKTCLIDFLGHNGNNIEVYASIKNSLEEDEKLSNGGTKFCYSVNDIINLTSSLVLKERRYISRKYCEAINDYSNLTSANIFNKTNVITKEGIEYGQKVVEFMNNQNDDNDYIYNCQTILKQEYVDYKKIPYIVSIVGYYFNSNNNSQKSNVFVGNIGDNFEGKVIITKCFETKFGYGINCKDISGNKITFFDKNYFNINKEVIIKGIVKDHNNFNDFKSTVLKKVKVL